MIESCQHSVHPQQNLISENSTRSESTNTNVWLKEARGVRDIIEDSKGNFWFSTPDYVARFDGKVIKYFSEKEGLNIVGNLHKGRDGSIWVENGIEIYHFNGKEFNKRIFDSVTTSKDFWFQRGLNPTDTTYVKPGAYHLDNKGVKFFSYPVEKDLNNKYLYFPTTKSQLGRDNIVWFGTMEKVFGFKNGYFISIGRKEMGRLNDERQMGIRGIFVDSHGNLWIADNGAGVFMYDGLKTINFTRKHHLAEGDVEGSTLHRAFSIAEDNGGNMWFGTVYSGVWMYNTETHELQNYTKEDGISSDNIWTIYKTRNGELLFAGETPGAVYKFNGESFDRVF